MKSILEVFAVTDVDSLKAGRRAEDVERYHINIAWGNCKPPIYLIGSNL